MRCLVLCVLGVSAVVSGRSYVSLPFAACSSTTPAAPENLLNVSSIYGQYDTGQTTSGQWGTDAAPLAGTDSAGDLLRLVAIARVGAQSSGFSNVTNYLATVITDAKVLSFTFFSNQSALCAAIRNATGGADASGSGCPYGPGDVAFGVDVIAKHAYPLTSITTGIRILDTSTPPLQLACYNAIATPFYPTAWPYRLILWLPVAIALAYALLSVVGRIWAAHMSALLDREAMLAASLTAKLSPQRWRQRIAPILWSAASGIGLQTSAPLRRFATPGASDVVLMVQWVALHGMVAVKWPAFAYPIFAKTAWSMLVYNVTLTQASDEHFDPLIPLPAASPFDAQFGDPTSPLYLSPSLPNVLLDLNGSRSGLDSLAAAIGLRRQDVFGVSSVIFLCICAGFLGLGAVMFIVDLGLAKTAGGGSAGAPRRRLSTADAIAYARKTSSERSELEDELDGKVQPVHRPTPEAVTQPWYRSLSGVSVKAHLRLLQGNLIRVLVLFHLPLVIFSTYQLSLSSSVASSASVALAALCLVFFCAIIPAIIAFKVYRTSEQALQADMATLLGYGPYYSTFWEGSYSFMGVRMLINLLIGIIVGALQSSGTAQAIIILICEIGETLLTSLWLPWGEGAAMGPLSFILSVARIVTSVLLVVLSPAVGVSTTATGWIAYVIFVVQAVVVVLFLLVLLTKMVELSVRIFGGVPFDESDSRNRAGGLDGALRRWDRAGKKGLRQTRPPAPRRASSTILENGSQQNMLHSRPTSMATSGYAADQFAIPGSSSPALHSTDEAEDGYVMAPIGTRWGHGEYATPSDYGPRSSTWSGDSALAGPSFTVVRGVKASDNSPYTLSRPDGRAANALTSMPGSIRSRSLHGDIEYVREPSRQSRPLSGGIDLLSNANATVDPDVHLSPNANAAAVSRMQKRQSAASGTGLFGFFRRNTSQEGPGPDDSSSDEDEDDEEAVNGTHLEDPTLDRKPSTTRWPFGIRSRRQRTPEADVATPQSPNDDNDDGHSSIAAAGEPLARGFVVVRPPKPDRDP